MSWKRTSQDFSSLTLFSFKGVLCLSTLVLAAVVLGFLAGSEFLGKEMAEKRQLDVSYQEQQQELLALQESFAKLESMSEIDKKSLQQVQGSLAKLQVDRAKSEEELWLYRHLLQEKSHNEQALGSTVRLVPSDIPNGVNYKLLLYQNSSQKSQLVKVGYMLSVKGTRNDLEEVFQVLDNADGEDIGARKASFKYFYVEEGGFQLPDEFEPEAVEVRIWQDKDVSSATTYVIPWKIAGIEQ